jgi:hypothetical protein
MTAIHVQPFRATMRGFALLRSSVAAGVVALAIGGTVLMEPTDMTAAPPSIDDGPLEVQSWNAAALAEPSAAVASAANAATVPAYSGPPVQSWEEIEAQLGKRSAGADGAVLNDPLATP